MLSEFVARSAVLAAGLYQRWRTIAHCTQPEPRVFCSRVRKHWKADWVQSAFRCFA